MATPEIPSYTSTDFEVVSAQVRTATGALSCEAARTFAAQCAAHVLALYTLWSPGDTRVPAALACGYGLDQRGYTPAVGALRRGAMTAAQEALDQATAILDQLVARPEPVWEETLRCTRCLGAFRAAWAVVCCLDPDPFVGARTAADAAAWACHNTLSSAGSEGVIIEHYRAVEERFWQLLQLDALSPPPGSGGGGGSTVGSLAH